MQLDRYFFLFLNSLHTSWLDPFFYLFTQTWFWIPLFLLVFFLIIKKWKKRSLIIILSIILAVLITDQSCNLIKNSVQRIRPSYEVSMADQIHLYQKSNGSFYKGGAYSFPSGHAANSMAFAMFIIFFIAERKRWIIFIALIWSFLMGYSRIYLGVHYPFDLLCGFTLGAIITYPLFYYTKKWVLKISKSEKKALSKKKSSSKKR